MVRHHPIKSHCEFSLAALNNGLTSQNHIWFGGKEGVLDKIEISLGRQFLSIPEIDRLQIK
jgi:hypothetical protein